MPDPDPNKTPDDPKKSAEDALVAMINAAAQRAVAPAVKEAVAALAPPPAPAPEPQRAATPSPLDDEAFQAEYQAAIAAGDGKKALALINARAINPMMAAGTYLAENQGKQNVERLADQFGEKFKKRKPLFEATMRKWGRSYADLADPDIADKMWKLTLIDDPSYTAEEVEARFAAIERQKADEAARAANEPPPLAPITDYVKVKDENVALAEKYMPRDAREREKILRKCASYRVAVDRVLLQVDQMAKHLETWDGVDRDESIWIPLTEGHKPKWPATRL